MASTLPARFLTLLCGRYHVFLSFGADDPSVTATEDRLRVLAVVPTATAAATAASAG